MYKIHGCIWKPEGKVLSASQFQPELLTIQFVNKFLCDFHGIGWDISLDGQHIHTHIHEKAKTKHTHTQKKNQQQQHPTKLLLKLYIQF